MTIELTDQELLELAAKAAGIKIDHWRDGQMIVVLFRGHLENYESWNPLEDDGDSLRLAVKLGISIQHETLMVRDFPASINCGRYGEDTIAVPWAEEPMDNNPYAATRRAIVRAAAEIGKAVLPDSSGQL